MDVLTNVMNFAEGAVNTGMKKAEQLKEVMLLKSRVDTCDEVIDRNYMEIGKLYCELHGEEPEEAFEKMCRSVKNAQRGKDVLEKELAKAQSRLKS